GMPGVDRELHLAVAFEVVDHVPAGTKIALAPVIASRTNDRVEIARGVLDGIGQARLAGLPRARYPNRAGRGRGGAADLIRFLAEQHVEALERTDQRRGHPGCAR